MTEMAAQWASEFDKIFEPYNRSDAPGLSVGVAKDNKLIYRKGFGLANVEHGVVNTPRTRFRIGSTTKHFTCLAALLLAENGKIEIDGSIRAYIPELGAQDGEPSLRQLMNHSSGYRCYIDLGFIADGEAVHPAANALEIQVQQARANFPPGERTIYCNGGYNLLSIAIERVTGKPFAEVLEELIFEPLGMLDTQAVPSDMEVHPRLAGLYVPRDGGWRRGIFITEGLRGEGNIISTVDDMLIWLAHLRGEKKVGSAETWKQMTTPPRLTNGFVSQYALGLILDTYRGVPVIHHGGSVTGGTCQMITASDPALDVIIITNGVVASADELGSKIFDVVLGDSVLAPKATPPSTDAYRNLLGQYHCARTGMVVGIEDMEGKVGLSTVGGMPMVAEETNDGLVSPFAKTVVGHFVVHDAKQKSASPPDALEISDSGNMDQFQRIAGPAPAADSIAPRLLGTFYAPDLKASATFQLVDGQLEMEIHGPYGFSVWTLRPMTETLLSFANKHLTYWTGVLNLKCDGDEITGFELTSKRTRQVVFDRT